MTFSIKNPVACVLTAMACVVLFTATASADIIVVWKTSVCPNFGAKTPIASVGGIMQAAVDGAGGLAGVGGVFCDVAPVGGKLTGGAGPKQFKVFNADIVAAPGDEPGPGVVPGDAYVCAYCQYPDKVIQFQAIPALSLLGTAILMGGLLTACLYELRKRRAAA